MTRTTNTRLFRLLNKLFGVSIHLHLLGEKVTPLTLLDTKLWGKRLLWGIPAIPNLAHAYGGIARVKSMS